MNDFNNTSLPFSEEQRSHNLKLCRAARRTAKTYKHWGKVRALVQDFTYRAAFLDVGDIASQEVFLTALEVELRNVVGNHPMDLQIQPRLVPYADLFPGADPTILCVEIKRA